MANVVAGAVKGIAEAARTRKLSKRQIIVCSLIILAALIIFRKPVRALLSVAALFALGAFSTYYKRKLESFGAVGFELVTFTTVLAGIAFGPVVGAVFGFVTSLVSVAISRDVGPTTAFFILTSAVIGAAAQVLSPYMGIVTLGLVSVAASAIATHFFTFLIQSELELKIVAATGIIVNFIVNYLMFAYLAKPILALVL